MSKVFVNVGMSLDGYVAPEGMDMAHADDPDYKDWMGKWTELQNWISHQEMFRESLGLGEGGETGRDNDILRETFNRTAVSIMGKRMFEGGERFWPEEAPAQSSSSPTRNASPGNDRVARPSTSSTTG